MIKCQTTSGTIRYKEIPTKYLTAHIRNLSDSYITNNPKTHQGYLFTVTDGYGWEYKVRKESWEAIDRNAYPQSHAPSLITQEEMKQRIIK